MEKEFKKVEWTPQALGSLRHVYDYIALDSEIQAEKAATEIALLAQSLSKRYHVYQECVQLPTKNHIYRKATYAGVYKVIYKIVKDEIWILDVSHGKLNPVKLKKLRRVKL